MDFGDPIVIGWAGVLATIAVWVLGTAFRPRRRLRVHFSGVSFVAAPDDDLGLAVTFQGEPIPEPVYLVQVQFQCGGNRDIAVEGVEEFVSIASGEGIDIVTARYGQTGETKLKVVESTSKLQKFKFDLLKKSEVISVNLYVRSRKKIEHESLPRLFKTAVHIRDVRKVMLAPRRFELWGATVAVVGVGGLYALTAIGPMFSALKKDQLLVDGAGQLVVAAGVYGDKVEVCTTSEKSWELSTCTWRPASELATYQAARDVATDRYMSRSTLWERVGLIAILAAAVAVMAFGAEISRLVGRVLDRIRGRE